MKTLHLTNAWSETSGGIATFYRAMMQMAERRKHSMVLVVPGPSNAERRLNDWVRIYEIAAPVASLNPCYRTIYPDQFLTGKGRLREILQRERPHVVEITDKYSLNYLGPLLRLGLAKELGERPVVIGLSCERMDVNFETYVHAGSFGRRFCQLYMRYLYFPFFDHHIAISEEASHELRHAAKGHEIPRGVFHLPMGVDCELFSPRHRLAAERCKVLRKIDAPANTILLLYAGRLAPEKNLPLLLETMERLSGSGRECRLLIAGDGICRAAFLLEAERRLGSRVTWLGHVSDREELARIYANCDFFLHPNPREPFGIAPLEAMASELVLVGPNSGGLKSFAGGNNACLVAPTGSEFATAVERVVLDDGLRREIRIRGRETAEQLSWPSVTDKFLDLYRKLVSVSKKEMGLEDANPAFISEAPSELKRRMMRAVARTASATFAAATAFTFSSSRSRALSSSSS